jgi:dTDP-4-dehydrorhamnose 3,5-epimerase
MGWNNCLLQHNDCILIEGKIFADERGAFQEVYNKKEFSFFPEIKQINLSTSKRNTIRGLHFNIRNPQAKLVKCIQGKIIDVVIDLRHDSPGFCEVMTYFLDNSAKILAIPEGFAHGFQAIEDNTIVMYGVNEYFDPEFDSGISPIDEGFEFAWSKWFTKEDYLVTDKDLKWPTFDRTVKLFAKDENNPFKCEVLL